MLIDEVLLRALCAELSFLLDRARIDKISQPFPHIIVIELFPAPDKTRLVLSCDRIYGFIGLSRSRLENPREPSPFCGLLRKHLRGARIRGFRAAWGDRAAFILLQRKDDHHSLQLNLGSGKANLFLLDDNGRPLGKMINYSHHHGSIADDPDYRLDGFCLDPPPAPCAIGIEEILSSGVDSAGLCSAVQGLPPLLARILVESRAPLNEKAEWVSKVLAPRTGRDAFLCPSRRRPGDLMVLAPLPGLSCREAGKLLFAAEKYFFEKGLRAGFEAHRLRIRKSIVLARKALSKGRVRLLTGIHSADNAKKFFHRGELLKSVMGKIPPRSASVEAFDWLTGKPVTIPLDPRLSPAQNLEKTFNRARKLRRSVPVLKKRLDETNGRLRLLAELETICDEADNERTLEDIQRRLVEAGLSKDPGSGGRKPARKRKRNEKSSKNRRLRSFRSSDGLDIFVGRSAQDNDYLRKKIAAGHDLWFHARDAAGAHVVVKLNRGAVCPERTRLEAARLAVHFSKRRFDRKAEVLQARACDVKKPPGSPPGLVTLRNFSTLFIEPDPGIVSDLLRYENLSDKS